MNTQRFSILMTAALVSLSAVPEAQKSGGRAKIKRVNESLQQVSLNLQTGVVGRSAGVQSSGFATTETLNNLDLSGFVGVDTGAGADFGPSEWWVRGDKDGGDQAQHAGGATGLLSGFRFAYCSSALDPNSGGPGGRAVISFREGYELGLAANAGGPSGVLAGAYTLSGLPANTTESSFFGGFNCYLIDVSLGSETIALGGDGSGDDPSVAWSWRFADLGTDGVLAATFPFLSCVASCTNGPGSSSGQDGVGMVDRLDQYCPSDTILASFSFGTTAYGNYFTSISMETREQIVRTYDSAELTWLPPPAAMAGLPHPFTEVQKPAIGIPGAEYTMDCKATINGAKPAVIRIGFYHQSLIYTANGGVYVPLSGGSGVNIHLGPHLRGVVSTGPLPGAPMDLAFVGAPYSVQGICGDTPKGWTSDAIHGQIEARALK